MKSSSYRDRDFAFGQMMLTLRTTIGLTQTGLAEYLNVSRRAVGDWEAGSSYPKPENLRQFIELAVKQRAFTAGRETEEIRSLWKAARQKVLLNEVWLVALLDSGVVEETAVTAQPPLIEQTQAPLPEQPAVKLPFQPTSFMGRTAELTEIDRIMANPACRLLTLLGPGGAGKTRLAMEVARIQVEKYTHGGAYIPLASVGTANQIVSAIAESLHLSFAGQRDPAAYLLNYLRERHLLLVLDNFEHLLAGVDLIYDILEHAPQVTILVTSRERLNLQVEYLYDVKGLAYPPEAADLQNLVDLADYTAVQLFIQRARQVQPDLPVLRSTLTTIARISQHIAGMPLAVELAAAGVRDMSIAEIDRQIRLNIDTLATTMRDVPARHRSMRAVFDHSWNLLSESERILLARLSIFRGGCTVAAAEQVVSALFESLMMLVDKSLLQIASDDSMDSADGQRFTLLEPVREYALEKLEARGEVETLQDAHAAYYLGLSESFMAQWDRPSADPVTAQISRDLNNIRAALQWAIDSRQVTMGLQLAGVLWRYWRTGGYSSEGRVWLEELLAINDANADDEALAARLLGMHAAAWLASDQHDYARATQLFEQTVSLRRALGKTEADTHMLHNAALQARAVGDYRQATLLLEEALARNGALSTGGLGQSLYEMGFSLYGLALMLREQGHFARAAALFEESLQFHREIGDRESMAQALLGLGDVARDQGDVARMRDYTNQSLAIYREFGTQWAIGFALNNLAQAAYFEGDLLQASTLATESVSLFRSIQNDGGLAEGLVTSGYILLAQGDLPASQEALMESIKLAWVVGPRLLMIAAIEGLALLMTQTGQAALAARFLGVTSAQRVQMGTPLRPADKQSVEQALAAARMILGDDAFAKIWAAAQQISLEQILSQAPLDGIPSQASASPDEFKDDQDSAQSLNRDRLVTRLDWDDALTVPTFYGREWEMETLSDWIIAEQCRVVSILGMGGMGKSALSVHFMRSAPEHFEIVIWRSLRDIPTCEVLLDDLLQALGPHVPSELNVSIEQRLLLLLEHLRSTRILMVLDNLESVLGEGESAGHMRPGYEGFGRFLHQSAATEHQSSILLTSREKPIDLVSLEGNRAPVRTLRLSRLDAESCEQLLAEKEVIGEAADRARLIESYAGNPLALKIVAQTISDLFNGEIAAFLAQGEMIFGSVRELLSEQFERLSPLEQSMMFWMAIAREPMTLDELRSVLVLGLPAGKVLEAIDGLRRRNMIERGQQPGSFTLQPVVLEYVTAQLISEVSDEILAGRPSRLIEYALELAQAREYIREIQERLILKPILTRLQSLSYRHTDLETLIGSLLDQLRRRGEATQGYGPANLAALLRLYRGHLRSVDLSRLVLRSAHLQGVEMQDANLSNAVIESSSFTETFDSILAIDISPDGKYWAASSRRGEILIWAAGGLTLYRAWRGHSDMVWTIRFSPNGRTLATGSWDGAVKVWDIASSTLLWSGRHMSHVNCVTFSPDNSLLASSGNDATVRIWDLQSGAQLRSLPHPVAVSGCGIQWSPDGRLLVSGDLEGVIRLWEIPKNGPTVCIQTFAGHTTFVDGLAFSPDGRTLASTSFDGTVKLWNLIDDRLKLRQLIAGHAGRIGRVAWSHDGRTLACAGIDKMVWLCNVEQGIYHTAMQGHADGITGLAFMPDGRTLLSSGDNTVRLWDVDDRQCSRVIQGYANFLYVVDWSPDGSQLVSGGMDTLVTQWDLNSDSSPRLLSGHRGAVCGIGWSPDAKWFASSEWENAIRLWNPASGACVRVLQYVDDPDNFFYDLTWSPDGQRLAVGTSKHGIQVFEMETYQQSWSAKHFLTWIRHVAWSPDGTKLVGGGDDGSVYVWDASDGSLLEVFEGHRSMILSVAWSPDGAYIASGSSGVEDGQIMIWNVERGECEYTLAGHPGMTTSLAWSRDSQLLVSGDSLGKLWWWDVRNEKRLWKRDAHQGAVQALRVSPDGVSLASCGDDGAIMLWEMSSGQLLRVMRRDRPYERLNMSGIKGLNDAQKASLRALGAVE